MIKPHTINTGVAICQLANTTPQEARDSIPAPNDLQPTIVSVALPVPLMRCFDYVIANTELIAVQVGLRVKVRFAGRHLVGFIVEVKSQAAVPFSQLKPVEQLLDSSPLLPNELWQLLIWSSQYYHHPIGEVLFSALPVLLRSGQPAQCSPPVGFRRTNASVLALKTLNRAAKMQQLLTLLEQQGWLALKTCRALGFASQIRRLKQLELIEFAAEPQAERQPYHAPPLTTEQQQVLKQIQASGQGFRHLLLQGITGSGKTEVYLRLLAQVLAAGQQALVLIPEIGLTPQTLQRFRQALDYPMVCLNSSMTDQARLDAWLEAASGAARLVLGTRSALFTPMPQLGLILIDEEHDASFKQQDGWRYSARDLALVRARNLNIPLLSGSATPSLDSLGQVAKNKALRFKLNTRATGQALAQVKLVDLRGQNLHQGLAAYSLQRIRHELQQGNQVLVFLNRRGFAPQLLCHACGTVVLCGHCDVALTLHVSPTRLLCHHCGRQHQPPSHCHHCGSSELLPQGLATAGLEQSLARLLPQARIIRIDRDSTRRKGQLDHYLHAIAQGEYNLLIGTQMLAKGHHFAHLSLVLVLDSDGALFSLDFRAAERLAQLLIQVAGRAGRERSGEVIIQTHQPEHPIWPELLSQDYEAFAHKALAERREARLPPYGHLALLRAQSRQPELAEAWLQQRSQELNAWPQIELLGPVPAPMPRKDGLYRWQLLLLSQDRPALHQALKQLSQIGPTTAVSWTLEVDPQELS